MPATKKSTLDIAQRIAEAIARTTEPTMSSTAKLNPETDTVLGTVPVHLRHLHNLLEAVNKEARTAEEIFRSAQSRHGIVRAVFFDALETHVPVNGTEYTTVKLCEGWKVAAYKHDFGDGLGDSLDGLLSMLTGERRTKN